MPNSSKHDRSVVLKQVIGKMDFSRCVHPLVVYLRMHPLISSINSAIVYLSKCLRQIQNLNSKRFKICQKQNGMVQMEPTIMNI